MPSVIATTSRCSEHGHPEIRVVFDQEFVLDSDVSELLTRIEESVAGGASYADGDTLHIGWVAARLVVTDDGTLSIHEPDMVFYPVLWVESVNHALIQQRLQLAVCASVLGSDDARFPSHHDTALLCERLGETEGFVMRRSEPEDDSSGWFVGCDQEGHEHDDPSLLLRASLYEIVTRYEPRIVPYLALPFGACVETRRGSPAISMNDQPLEFRPGSVLESNFPQG